MDINSLIITCCIGAISGWLAGQIKDGYGFGLIGNIILGIIGAFVGQWLFNLLHISIGTGIVSVIITSVAGALVVLFLMGFIKGRK